MSRLGEGSIADRRYVLAGEGRDRAPTGAGYVFRPVWRDAEGQWWCSHPTDPLGPDVRWDGEVQDVRRSPTGAH